MIEKNKPNETSEQSQDFDLNPAQQAYEILTSHDAGIGIDFQKITKLAADCGLEILEHWLPDGEKRNGQYVALNPTRNDGNLGSFQIKIENGLWKDFSSDDGGSDYINLVAYLEGTITQTAAAVKILKFIAGIDTSRNKEIVQRVLQEKSIVKPEYVPILPVPKNAKNPPVHFGRYGAPTKTWEYRNESGELLFLVNRFKTESGKAYFPLTWCKDDAGWECWRMLAPPAPRPLYNLNLLAERREAIVLFTEGEKAADAAQRLFPEFVAVTTMNGAQSPEKTDLSSLAGRIVYIARDNDNAGLTYQTKLIELLNIAGAHVRATMNLSALENHGTPVFQGYDLADAEAAGWNAGKLKEIGESLWCEIPKDIAQPNSLISTSPNEKGAKELKVDETHKKIPDQVYADAFIETLNKNILTVQGRMLAYRNGYWKEIDPEVDVKKPLIEILPDSANAAKLRGVYELIRVKTATSSEKMQNKASLICLKNGALDPMRAVLHEHSPDFFLTNQVNIEYKPSETCPLWIQTLNEIFQPDEDREEKIQLIQEFMGYCLVPDTRHAKFIWMVGAGGNGKSLVLSVFTEIIGKANISYAQIERLERAPVRAELHGKLLNISSEMSADATLSDSYLKQIVAGEVIEAEPKFERSFSFKATARIIAATNSLPRLLDHSDGFARRAIILRFNRQFTEAERDITRESKLMTELPGILNWALAGLTNLEKRGKFLTPKSSNEELAQYRVKSDPVKLFNEEFLSPTEERSSWTGCQDLYTHYKDWSVANGYRSLSRVQFGDRLEAMGFKKTRTNGGKRWSVSYGEKLAQPSTVPEATSVAQPVKLVSDSKNYRI